MSKENLKNKNHTSHFAPHTSNRGITLLSLILTVIIMLILTGVALSIALGENGIVEKAKEATTQTQVAMDRELLLSAAIGAMGNDGKVNLSAMVLPEGFTGSNGTYTSKNGNTFTVSEMGDVVFAGGSDSDEGTVALDVNGKYYMYVDWKDIYIEIKNNDTLIVGEDGEETMVIPIVIDEQNQTITMEVEYEGSGNREGVVSETVVIKYDFVIENGKIVNKILVIGDESDGIVFFQNENGFKYDLDGTYVNDEGNKKYTFVSGSSTVTYEYSDSSSSGSYNQLYASVNGIYFFCDSGDNWIFKVSKDKNEVAIYEDKIYTKQTN